MEMVAEVLRPLRATAEERLYAIPWIAEFPIPHLAAAALMMRWASRYANGERPDDLIAAWRRSADEPANPMPADDARELTLLARLMVLSGMLPNPRWWEPFYHSEHLAIACAREAIAANLDAAEIVGRRLDFSPPDANAILEKAKHPPGINFSVDAEAAGELAERLESYLRNGVAGDVLNQTLQAIPEALEERLDLGFAAAQLAQLRTAAQGAQKDGDNELLAFIAAEAEKFGEARLGLSLLELELMREVDDDEQLLMEVAAVAKRTIAISKHMGEVSGSEGIAPTELTDLIDGNWLIPNTMDLYLGLAGQNYQQRVGPIVNWSITFERLVPDGFDLEGPKKIGIELLDDTDTEFIVRTSYEGEDVDAHIYYPPASASSTMGLAILALTGRVRLDFYVASGTRSIRLISQGGIAFTDRDQYARIFQRAVSRCRELMANGEKGVVELLEREHSEEEMPLIAFLMNESGKSEQLLDARSPGAALGPHRKATPEQEAQLAEARRQLLRAEAQRIEDPTEARMEAAAAEASSYIGLVQRSRGPDSTARGKRSVETAEQALEGIPRDRAVVHMTVDARGLELAWADRAEDRVHLDLITCEEVDLAELEETLVDPEGGSVAALDREDGPGIALGKRLHEQMMIRGVEELLVCSTRHLHQLPVHALLIAPHEDQRLIDVANVAYAPSASIASALAGTPPRPGPRIVAAANDDLLHGADEAALVTRLVGAEEMLVGEASTPSRLLSALRRACWIHVTSHGSYMPQDYLASNLSLPADGEPEARLTVARILAEADLAGIDLAVLGACQSGAGQTEIATLDVAGGIDTAFLATGVRNVVSALWEIDDFGALLFHGELYRGLAEGETLFAAYRQAIDLLRSGAWKEVQELPLGGVLADLSIDVTVALEQLLPGDDGIPPLDLSDLQEWAPYRICGLGKLGR
jgi:CHAT domain-containing protein